MPAAKKREINTVEIDSIESKGQGKAWNITMDKRPNFLLGNGILTHNTNQAQAALRRTMEDYPSSRFILIGNYPNRIIRPIRDRCTTFPFTPVDQERGVSALARICEREGMDTDRAALEALWEQNRGSMRGALNALQSFPPSFSADDVQRHAPSQAAKDIMQALAQGETRDAEQRLLQLIRSGVSSDEVFRSLFDVIDDSSMNEEAKDNVLFRLGEYEYRVQTGCSLDVQARCFLREMNSLRRNGP
jgi:replication factor C small subunit